MSIEPTCDFCGYSDKFRCKSHEEADKCENNLKEKLTRDVRPDHILPKAERDSLPHLSLTKNMGMGRVTVKTHQAGVIGRLNVSIERAGHGSGPTNFTLHPEDVEPFIEILRKAHKYTKQGIL